jgi:hypothetical protein
MRSNPEFVTQVLTASFEEAAVRSRAPLGGPAHGATRRARVSAP